nr:MAG TPA: replisome organizer [Caudoviricetes sp.]
MARRGYVQLVNGFYDNDKVRDLVRRGRADSVGVYCMALSLCGDRLTDGFVPRRAMLSNIGATPEQVRALVDEGMLDEVDEGWIIHDYTVHNRTKEQVLHARAAAKERKSKSRCHSDVTSMSQRDSVVTSGQTPEHQNTRTQKKEKEEYSSSFSKETVKDFGDSRECGETDRTLAAEYPNLDLTGAWNAFANRHHGETRSVNDWTRLWKGWCQRRANMSGVPPSKRHIHTWQCEHVLQALGRDRETATPDQQACQMAKQLNKEENAK